MNLNNVFLFVKTGVTNVTFEWFLSIVNWSNVFSQTALVRRAVITSSHLNVLFSSWTGSMCIFKLPFWQKQLSQMSHLSGFFTSWISELCFLKFFWREIFWLDKGIQNFSSFQNHQKHVSLNCSLQEIFVTNITFERLVRIVDRRFGTRNCLYQKHFLVWPRVGHFKEQVFRAYLNSIWMTLCTPRCKSTTPGCYFYVFLLMVRNSTLVKKCVFYDSFFWMLLWHGADFTIDRKNLLGQAVVCNTAGVGAQTAVPLHGNLECCL